MRRTYQTEWVGETCLGSQTVICPGFHLTDWLQSQWVPLMAFCWGREGGGSTPPPSESLLSWGPRQHYPLEPPEFSICCSLKISFWG